MGISSAHFSDQELACKGTTCGLQGHGCHDNFCTERLVDGLEQFRAKAVEIYAAKYGAAHFTGVLVHDAYRCLKHNAQTTGAVSDSQHTNGRAADISVVGLTAAELEECALDVPMFAAGGIGRDDVREMIHVDCRPSVARWCYYKQADGSIKWGPYEAAAKDSATLSV
jgi:hypothetical protein